jgi:hypothetical protein
VILLILWGVVGLGVVFSLVAARAGGRGLLAALIFLGCVASIGAFGGLIGYLDGRNTQVGRDQARLRVLKESIEKGSGGDIARADARVLEKKIESATDDGRASARAVAQGERWAQLAALIGLLPLGLWALLQRLRARAG